MYVLQLQQNLLLMDYVELIQIHQFAPHALVEQQVFLNIIVLLDKVNVDV